MSRARIYYRFDVRDVFVAADVIGVEHAAEVDGVELAITIPADPRIFDLSTTELPSTPIDLDRSVPRAFGALQVAAEIEVPIGVDEALEGTDSFTTLWTSMVIELQRVGEVVHSVVGALISHSRVALGQIGLGVSSDPVRASHWQRIADVATGRFYPVSISHPTWATFRPNNAAPLSSIDLDRLMKTGWNEPLPTPYVLLADARHMVWKADAPRSTLLAAMACELRVKETLRSMATPDTTELVEMLFRHPRDWKLAVEARQVAPGATRLMAFLQRQRSDDRIAVINLFHTAMLAVCERSLQREDAELWGAIGDLIQARNMFAHSGAAPSRDAANLGVRAAFGAFVWLERVEARIAHEISHATPPVDSGHREA